MSRLDPRYFSPAQVFAQFSSSGKNEGAAVGKTECKNDGSTPNNRREIQITETGEVSLPPDKARVSVVCSNAKVSDGYSFFFFCTMHYGMKQKPSPNFSLNISDP